MTRFSFFISILAFQNNLIGQECKIPPTLETELAYVSTTASFGEKDFYRINTLLFELQADSLKTLPYCPSYSDNIRRLFDSENPNKRVLAYRLIGSAKDPAFNVELRNRLKSDENSLLKTWSAIAVLENDCASASDDIFRLLSAPPEGLPGDVLINMYARCDQDAVKKTCWKFVDSPVRSEQIIAIQCLSTFGTDKELQAKLMEFLNTWEGDYKGWVIAAMAMQHMGNLSPFLKKYAEVENLRDVVIRALLHSPTKADVALAKQLEKEKK
ncbi:MAG: hypothetical protein EOO50_07410 [Flavobacterium sp.]|uniref:hypothetical protein n=1 Tax=Flavobacterium sp. TaxID=239 RepID=UPI0012113592|nr:hypothetical protein [Flavobacterium sp.]RZJ67082.1 MAG: hypothetical protein EOO50_07410 [Flavobacterium sp.]